MHGNSKFMFERHARSYFRGGDRVLEIGPNRVPSAYAQIVADPTITWDTLDIRPDQRLTYVASSPYSFPVESDSYDVVVSGQVLEHVEKIWVWMQEVARVCRPGGCVVTVNPVSWPYHEAPVDCWRAFPAGMKALYDHAGLDVELSEWGTMEASRFKRHVPGRSPEWQPKWLRNSYRILGRFGFPVECAYDTVTVGRKRKA